MKRSYFLLFFSAMISIAFFDSCKKDSTDNTDTPPTPSKTPEELLTANPWQISKIRTLQGGSIYYYLRGSSNHDLDNEAISFNSNHTGTYTEPTGAQRVISSWNFIDAEKTQLQYTIMFSTPLIVNWENFAITSSSIKYGEYHALNGINAFSIATRIPK